MRPEKTSGSAVGRGFDSPHLHEVSGILLYVRTDEAVYPENEYRMSGKRVGVRTLNLDSDFDDIKAQLDGIAAMHYEPAAVGAAMK